MVTERTFMRMLPTELDQLSFEMDRYMRDIRSEQPALDDLPAIQQRNRKILRLNTALMMLRAYRQKRR